jgi:hypothetical protein
MLWSDIGCSFYAAHGWKAMSSTHVSLPPISRKTPLQPHNQMDTTSIRELSAQNLQNRVCPAAVANLETQLRVQSEKRPGPQHIAIRPDYHHMQWHWAREDFQARTLYNKNPNVKGVEDSATGCALIWSRVYGETPQRNKLYILHAMIPLDATGDITGSIAALLLRAQLEAKTWDMHGGVELWDPSTEVLDAAQFLAGEEKVKISIRDKESICSLRWMGGKNELVEWVASEKYVWC